MRVLITGGAGFVGSHLAEKLLSDGHEVFVIDDLSTGSLENILHLDSHPRFNYQIEKIENESVLSKQIDNCQVVFHLAAAVGVRLIVNEPVRTIETNVHGTEVVLRCAAKKNRLVLLASTSEVYGKGTNFPFSEDANLVIGSTKQSRWAYACSKALDEFLALAYLKEKNLPVVVMRLFNTVGPRQTGRYGMVIPNFVRQALNGEPITVFGDGTQTRSFVYVGDTVQALAGLMNEPKAIGEVFNIGNDQEVSIRYLAQEVKRITQSSSEIVTVPYEEAYETGFEDMPRRVPDLRKVKAMLNWSPKVNLEEILQRVIKHVTASKGR